MECRYNNCTYKTQEENYVKSTLYYSNTESIRNFIYIKNGKKFIEEYKKLNLDDEVTVLDLYKEDIKPLSLENLQNFFTPDEEMKKYVDQFIAHDKYVIAAPFWNLSIPAILKVYIDRIVIPGKTFKYTESGAIGLLSGQGKKVKFIVSRGGVYINTPMGDYEFGEKYLRGITGFIGIESFETIAFEGAALASPEITEKKMEALYPEIERQAKEF